jgi:hypothetical protein
MITRKSGYFLVYRDIYKHKAFKNIIEASVWLYMISSATHQDKTLGFFDNPIFLKRSEMIFPIRKTASIFKMTYSEMRSFLLKLKRKKMIKTRLAHLQPTNNHKYRSVTVISIENYDKFQYVEAEQSLTAHLSPVTNKQYTNTHTNILTEKIKKSSNSDYKKIGEEGHYWVILKDSKKYLKHKFKDIPLEEY